MATLCTESRILLVDDSMIMRKTIGNILAKLGYTNITEASHGLIALEAVQDAQKIGAPFRVIFLDVSMPEMDGTAFLKTCRSDPSLADTAIIMVTAVSEKSCMIEALQNGATAYVTKPFSPEQIAETMQLVTTWAANNGQG